MEAWYGIMGLGAVCHTLNPRLSAKDIAWIANHGRDTWIMADATFLPLLEQVGGRGCCFHTREWMSGNTICAGFNQTRAGGILRDSIVCGVDQLFAIQEFRCGLSSRCSAIAACCISYDRHHNLPACRLGPHAPGASPFPTHCRRSCRCAQALGVSSC
jgi:hypothetical protein